MRKRKLFFFYLASLLPASGWGGEWSRRRRTKMFPGEIEDEQDQVFPLLEQEPPTPTKRVLCLPPSLACQITPHWARRVLGAEGKQILVISSERSKTTAERLSNFLRDSRYVVRQELGGHRNVMLDNRGLFQFLLEQPEEHVIIIADPYRIVSLLLVFVKAMWDIRVPQVDQGVLIDPEQRRATPV